MWEMAEHRRNSMDKGMETCKNMACSGSAMAGVEAQGSREGGHGKGCEIDAKTFWDQHMKPLWTRFYCNGHVLEVLKQGVT